MINLTNKILTKNTEELKTQTPILLHKTIQVLKEHKSEINPKYSAFIDKIDPFAPVNINENFINNILKYAIEKDFNCNEINELIKENISLLEKPFIKNGLKLFFLELWKQDLLILPLSFNLGNSFNEKIFSLYDNEITKTIKKEISNDDAQINKMCRLIRATDYKNFKDPDILEINELHISLMKQNRGLIDLNIPQVRLQIEGFLNLVKTKNESFNFDAFEYKQWLSGYFKRHIFFNYLEYQNNKEELENYRKKYNNEQTKERRLKKQKENGIPQKELTIEDEFFFQAKTRWAEKHQTYNGYSFPDTQKKSKLWIEIFKSYQSQRKKNGYESTKTGKQMFNFLMNYIFFYLPLWSQKHKEIKIPETPKDFHRTLFVKNPFHKEGDSPYTITQLLDYRHSSNSYKNSILRNIEIFFNFISDFYPETPEIWDEDLKNPIRKSDYYREFNTKKTDKVIIPKNIYGKLKKYLFALEFFGEYLEEKQNKGLLKIDSSIKNQNIIKSENYGFIPIFFDKNKAYPIFNIPNTLLLKKRKQKNPETGKIRNSSIVSNTVIRALILMLNTGLRAAQVEWLDIRNWDKHETEGEQKTYYKLNVNTDKTKNKEWMSYISNSVYYSLKKETNFQNSMMEDFMNLEVNYQSREYSRFENIIPLFKSDSPEGKPVNFRYYWEEILWQFQNVLNNIEDENYKLITLSKPKNINIKLIGEKRNKYCPLRIKAIHTPHSMRATFCTHMAEYLERSEIAALVGHSSDLITSEVYIKPEDSVLKEKIERAVDIFDNGVNSDYFDKDSSVHSKPHLKGSSLQKAFSENREQTIELFNITSVSLNINKDSEEQSQKAIKLLKEARADQVVFEGTHICPVGGVCPQEVMGIIGEKRRCGLCPLALKCVDNLNPIYAKQRDLMREIKEGKEKLDLAIKNKESNISINNLEDKINLDIKELVSWKFSADILSKYYEELKKNKDLDKKYYVEMPDMVKQHLQKVSISNEKEYLLTRIADSNAYSSYQNPENKYQAEMLRRNLIKNLNLFEYDDYYVSEEDKIEVFCSMIKNMLDANDIGLKQLVNSDCFKPIEQKKQLKELSFKDIKLLK